MKLDPARNQAFLVGLVVGVILGVLGLALLASLEGCGGVVVDGAAAASASASSGSAGGAGGASLDVATGTGGAPVVAVVASSSSAASSSSSSSSGSACFKATWGNCDPDAGVADGADCSGFGFAAICCGGACYAGACGCTTAQLCCVDGGAP